MISRGLSAFRGKRVLLLQGPVGPFFRRLSEDLTNAGAKVFKINLNGGDWIFYPTDAISFTGGPNEWPAFIEDILSRFNIDTVMLFGDCRFYHKVAHAIADARGLEIGVFEEGYLRPDYVTLERSGVNGYSSLPTNPIYYLNTVPSHQIRTDKVGNTFWYGTMWSMLYYVAAHLLRFAFPRYEHHRPLSMSEAWPWMRSVWRKAYYRVAERGVEKKLIGGLSKQFYLVPLQVYNDAQICVHSEFESVEQFIRHVVQSFAQHAPAGTTLVIKQHPMDRAYSDYRLLISTLAVHYGLGDRLLYIHDQHLPSLLDHARGVIVVNSTVGLSALIHNAPLKVCGQSIYALKGLVYQGSLDSFWGDAEHFHIDRTLFDHFRSYLVDRTQLNGSFYKRLPIVGSATGMRWEERWLPGDQDRRHAPRTGARNEVSGSLPVSPGDYAGEDERGFRQNEVG
jgi:capsular polysaccharide export protein